MTASSNGTNDYASIRASVDSAGDAALSRVEVNQRALIDKILARYASQGAVYRELIQNSNDADATQAEIYFTTESEDSITVSQVVYRNNGMPFRGQDWDRLKKIAEGNPDVSKVGAFGVGAYTMFSICEEPLVLSGNSALAFVWKGDALWTKTVPNNNQSKEDAVWTSFVLPSRDPYPLPNLTQFGEFLCASLTFTAKLRSLRVFFNKEEKLSIVKTIAQEPRLVQTPKSSSFWMFSNNNAVTSSTKGLFSLAKSTGGGHAIYESLHRMTVMIENNSATLDARYVSATAKASIPSDMARRMQRVTKKDPPEKVDIQIFLNAETSNNAGGTVSKPKNKAERIVQSFSPRAGQGRIFIGFRTSQTTGLAAHLAAPFVPTVEREAMDLQDGALRIFNMELLEFSGILMRLTLEHTMLNVIGVEWEKNREEREKEEKELLEKLEKSGSTKPVADTSETNKGNATNSEDDDEDDGDDESTITGGVLRGFARFMARGVKKSIATVAKTVETLMEDNTDKLLYPPDPRPLSQEERQAVVLMQSFCPQQSTPDATVGTCLATGFSKCLPKQSPPVLTKSGVMRGDLARLPHYGIEAFCEQNVIRQVVFQNCEEYHTVIARSRRLCVNDLLEAISGQVLEEAKALKLIQWWTRYSRAEPIDTSEIGMHLKNSIRFHPEEYDKKDLKQIESTDGGGSDEDPRPVIKLRDLDYYLEKDSYFATREMLPLPDSVIPRNLQKKIGLSTLTDVALRRWFSTLPIQVWAEFVSNCSCMIDAKPEDELIRIQVLTCLSQEYSRRIPQNRPIFAGFCHRILADKRCIPFDSDEPSSFAADYPADLYLPSAELKAFQGVGNASFRKVAASVKDAGVSDDFLLALGVRKSVSIDFLFTNLDTLRWSEDPKALIEYLRTATLTRGDLHKLSTTQYLPAEGDDKRTYAPAQLYLPNSQLKIFPFIKMLQWPSESEVSENSANGQFLKKLGMKTNPPLQNILEYASYDDLDHKERMKCLDFICERLGPHGLYYTEYSRMSYNQKTNYRCLPCSAFNLIEACFSENGQKMATKQERHSPVTCFSDEMCGVMGFPILDKQLVGEKNSKLYGSLFQCRSEPESSQLIKQFGQLILQAKKKQEQVALTEESATLLEATFATVFKYMSHRSSDLSYSAVDALKRADFIPVRVDENKIEWYRPDEVFFRRKDGNKDNLTEELFRVVEFNPFLAAAGVKEEASTRDLFIKMLSSPEGVLRTLGSEKKYRALLRRIAANLPFHPSRIPAEVQNSPFLLAYTVKPVGDTKDKEDANTIKSKSGDTISYHLAKASDIYIIDNSFFARMFPVNRAPPETDLEDFYALLGSKYISQSVDRRFEVVGKPSDNTNLTRALKERLEERGPLLISPNVTSRPLVSNAASIIEGNHLQIFEAMNLMAVYSLDGTTRRNKTTCCSRGIGRNTNGIYVVKDFDWFDVGYAIGDLILMRCQLEDAFFISSLLEAPLEQLRARGFPVDRIIQPFPAVVEPPSPPKPKPKPIPTPTMAEMPKPTIAQPPTNSVQSAAKDAPVAPTTNASEGAPAVQQPTQGKPTNEQKDSNPGDISNEGLQEILKQMFPDADPNYLIAALGPNPTIDDVRALAEQMASGNYPKKQESSTVKTSSSSSIGDASEQESPPLKKKGGGLKKKLGRALGFGGGHSKPTLSAPPMNLPGTTAGAGTGQMPGALVPGSYDEQSRKEERDPVSPATDAQSQKGLEHMLENAVSNSSQVQKAGIESPETKLTSIPKELDIGEHGCEIVPGHSLKPFPGPRDTGKTRNGIRVFSSKHHPVSEKFLNEYDPVLESFAHVIERLCVGVFGLKIETIAIFHDPAGKTIAFNSNRALHFNLRFFYSLHFLQNKHLSIECYSYWYMTISHELAHHMVSAHTREHGFYTESYATHYLPKLMVLLNDL